MSREETAYLVQLSGAVHSVFRGMGRLRFPLSLEMTCGHMEKRERECPI